MTTFLAVVVKGAVPFTVLSEDKQGDSLNERQKRLSIVYDKHLREIFPQTKAKYKHI